MSLSLPLHHGCAIDACGARSAQLSLLRVRRTRPPRMLDWASVPVDDR